MDGNGDTEAKNVIRLPRDWVGPPEELVPLGSRAREARATEDGDRGDVIPDAGDFWGEAASAVHHAMPAPTETPTAGRARRRRELPRWPRVRPRTAVIAAIVGVIAVVAILGVSEGHGHGPRAAAAASAAAAAPAHTRKPATTSHAATARQGGSERAAPARTRAIPVRAFSERPSARHVVTRRRHARSGASPARHAATRHPRSVIATPVTTPVTPTVAPPTTSTVVPTTATTARAGTTTSAASTQRTPSPAAGPTGSGEAINCDPKCS